MRSIHQERANADGASLRVPGRLATVKAKSRGAFAFSPAPGVKSGQVARITRGSATATPSAVAAPRKASMPVAVRYDGEVIGLALNIGKGFRFFSGAHRTDPIDGKVFGTLPAIRLAVRALR